MDKKDTKEKARRFRITLLDLDSGEVLSSHDTSKAIIAFDTAHSTERMDIRMHLIGDGYELVTILNAIVSRMDISEPLVLFINKVVSRLPLFDLMKNHGEEV